MGSTNPTITDSEDVWIYYRPTDRAGPGQVIAEGSRGGGAFLEQVSGQRGARTDTLYRHQSPWVGDHNLLNPPLPGQSLFSPRGLAKLLASPFNQYYPSDYIRIFIG